MGLFNYCHSHFNVIYWSVSASSCSTLNHFNHIKTFLNLSEHCILAVKMGSATNCRVYLQLVIGQTRLPDLTLSFRSQFVLQFL